MSAPLPSPSNAPVPGHEYRLRGAGVLRNVLGTLGTVLGVGLCVRLFLGSSVAPGPSFTSDADTTIIAAKVALARNSPGAGLALVGDSSCLMDLDVATLEASCPLDVVNLGTLSYLGLDAFGQLAGELLRGRQQPRVVLVIHPEALRIASRSPVHRATLQSALGTGRSALPVPRDGLAAWLGFDDLRLRVSDRWVPHPLKGAMGSRYGFTEDLWASLMARKGTMDEPARFDARKERGSAEYRLAARLESECHRFREALPEGTRIRLIVTPVPQSHALPGHQDRIQELRSQMEVWLGAEASSWDLPLVLPDADFGTVTHLTPEGAVRYSRLVGSALCSWE